MLNINIKSIIKNLVVAVIILVSCFMVKSNQADAEIVQSKVTSIENNLVSCMIDNDYYEFYDTEDYYNVGDEVVLDVQVIDNEIEVVNSDKIFNITSYEFKKDGSQITNYNDGSFAYINTNTNEYEFTPVNFLGDWNYNCSSIEDLNNLILDYKKAHDSLLHSSLIKNYGEIIETESFKDKYDNEIKVYNDGSYLIINELTGTYEFYPVITSNNNSIWCMSFDNMKDLENCIYTYISLICDGEY